MTKQELRNVATIAALRGVSSLSGHRMYWVMGTNQIFKYDKTSMAVDDGVTVVKPTSVNVLNPGRWLLSLGVGAGAAPGGPAGGDLSGTYPNPTVPSKGVVLRFPFPGVLNITENAYILPVVLDRAVTITQLNAFVKTAPVGANIIVTFKKITLATGALSASIGAVTILAGANLGTPVVVSVALATSEGLVMEMTQVGSVNTEGSNLVGWGIAA